MLGSKHVFRKGPHTIGECGLQWSVFSNCEK